MEKNNHPIIAFVWKPLIIILIGLLIKIMLPNVPPALKPAKPAIHDIMMSQTITFTDPPVVISQK